MRTFLALAVCGLFLNGCVIEEQVPAGSRLKRSGKSSAAKDTADDGDSEEDEEDPKGSSSKPSSPNTPSGPATPQSTTIKSSKGTGGAVSGEQRSAAGLSFIVDAPAATKPRGLLVLLHGSTASNYREFVGRMNNVATQHDLVRVSILAPNGQGWNEGNQENAAELLHRTVQEDVLAKYDIDLAKVFFSGQSSGGGFLSSHFLPLHAKDYRGGAFLQCGAAPPFRTFAPDDATKQGLKLHFEITTGDTIWPQSYANAVSTYTTAGMTLSKDNTKTGGHCAFDQQQVILDHISAMLLK